MSIDSRILKDIRLNEQLETHAGAETEVEDPKIPQYPVGAEAIKLLNTRRPFPMKAKKFFGPMQLKELADIIYDPAMIEIDTLQYSGYLSFEETKEYTGALPEHQEITKKMHRLAAKFASVLGRTIRSALQKSIPSVRNETVTPGKYLGEILKIFAEIIRSQQVPGINQRNGRLWHFRDIFLQYFSIAIDQALHQPGYTDLHRDLIDQYFFKPWNDHFLKTEGYSFPGVALLGTRAHSKEVLKKYGKGFQEMLDAHEELEGNGKKKTDAELKEENALIFEEVRELAQLKKIFKKNRRLAGGLIAVFGDEYKDTVDRKRNSLCFVRINFDPKVTCYRPVLERKGDQWIMHHTNSPAAVEFHIDCHTGAICYITSSYSNFDAMKPRQHLVFKNAVLSFLLDYLEGRSERIVQPNVASQASPVVDKLVEAGHIDEEKRDGRAVFDEEEDDLEEKAVTAEREYFKKLKSTSGRKILRALIAILGDPLHQVGSHVKFRTIDGKSTGVVPIIAGRNIKIHTLKGCLESLGVTAKELCAHL